MRTSWLLPLTIAATLVGCGSDDAGSNGSSTDAGSSIDAGSDGSVGQTDGSPDATDAGGDTGSDTSTQTEAGPDSADDAGGTPPSAMISEVSQYGITWTFDKEYPCGQFVTGDWWCVGPVTVSSVSPEPTGERNGSMVNPVNEQAYDARAGKYDGTKAAAFPLDLAPTASLVSSSSHPDQSECEQGSSPGWYTYNDSCQRGPIHTQAVLTVVAEPQFPR